MTQIKIPPKNSGRFIDCMRFIEWLESTLTDVIRHCSTTMVDVRIVSLLLVT